MNWTCWVRWPSADLWETLLFVFPPTPILMFFIPQQFWGMFNFIKSMLILPLYLVYIHYPGNTGPFTWISGSVSEGLSGFAVCRPKQGRVTLLGHHALLSKPCPPFGHPRAIHGRMALSGSVLRGGRASPVRSCIWMVLCSHRESFLRCYNQFLHCIKQTWRPRNV